MKSLALSLALLFLIGAHGHSIARRGASESPESKSARPSSKESLKNLYKNTFKLMVELATMADSPNEDIINHIDSRIESLIYDSYNVACNAYTYVKDVYDETEKEIQEMFPIFKTEVEPIIEQANQKYLQYLWSLKDELLSGLKALYTVSEEQELLIWNKFLSLIKRDEAQLKVLREELVSGLMPYVGQVKQELAAAEKQEAAEQADREQFTLYKDIMKGLTSHKYTDVEKFVGRLEELSVDKADKAETQGEADKENN